MKISGVWCSILGQDIQKIINKVGRIPMRWSHVDESLRKCECFIKPKIKPAQIEKQFSACFSNKAAINLRQQVLFNMLIGIICMRTGLANQMNWRPKGLQTHRTLGCSLPRWKINISTNNNRWTVRTPCKLLSLSFHWRATVAVNFELNFVLLSPASSPHIKMLIWN